MYERIFDMVIVFLITLFNFFLTYVHESWPEESLIHTISRQEEIAFLQHSGSYDPYPVGCKYVRKITENETNELAKDSVYRRTVKTSLLDTCTEFFDQSNRLADGLTIDLLSRAEVEYDSRRYAQFYTAFSPD